MTSSPKPKWSARMGSVMRRTSSVLTIPRRGSVSSERDTDNSSLTGSTRGRRESSGLVSPPLPSVVTPSIADSPLRDPQPQDPVGPSPLAKPISSSEIVPPTLPPPVENTQSPSGNIPPPVIDSTLGNPGAFADVTDQLPQPEIAQDPQPVASVEPHVESVTLDTSEPTEPEAIITEDLVEEPASYFDQPMVESIKDFDPVDHADNTTEAVHGIADDDPPEPQHHEQNGEAAEYYHDDVIPTISEVAPENANVVLPEPNVEQREEPEVHDHEDAVPVVAAAEPERREEPQQIAEPISVPVPVTVPHLEQDSKVAEYDRGDVIPSIGEVVPENANVVLPEQNLKQREEPEAHHHDDAVPAVTEPERQEEPQQEIEPIAIPVPVPVPNYPINLGSEREVWSGEHDHGVYPSSVPVVNPSSEDVERVDASPAPSIKFVDFSFFFKRF